MPRCWNLERVVAESDLLKVGPCELFRVNSIRIAFPGGCSWFCAKAPIPELGGSLAQLNSKFRFRTFHGSRPFMRRWLIRLHRGRESTGGARVALRQLMSASLPVYGILSGPNKPNRAPRQGSRPMELTVIIRRPATAFCSRLHDPDLSDFSTDRHLAGPLSHRHRYVTEVIFAGGNVGNGHWCRFHRFFSHAAWDMDILALFLAKLVSTILAPGSTLFWAVDDTLCRKRGLTLYGAGMHYDPLISGSRCQIPGQLGARLGCTLPGLSRSPSGMPTKVFALPIAVRLYRNRQGLTKGKKGRGKASKPNPDHRTRPQLALELIQLVAQWYPDDEIILTGDSAYGGKSILSHLPPNVHLISQCSHPAGSCFTNVLPLRRWTQGARERLERKGPAYLACQWAKDPAQPWTRLKFHQFGLHATLAVKTMKALYYKAGGDREADDRLGARPGRETSRSRVLLHQAELERARQIPDGILLPLGD